MIRSDLAWSTVDRIVVRGKDLPKEILGHLNLGDMAFLEITGRVPNANESKIFNAMVVTLVEHGVTPSALAARMTYVGAPEAMQAAVAAGLCGLGSVFVGSMEGCAKLLTESKDKTAEQIVAEGVETVEQLNRLAEYGCDVAQGYLLGRPSPFGTLYPGLEP